MFWLLSAIFAYFLLSVASVGDRFLLVGPLPSPKVYAFFIALLGGLTIPFFAFFGFEIPDRFTILLSLIYGFLWIVALVFYFKAVMKSEASRAVPATGALVPIFTFLIGAVVFKEILSFSELIAFLFLILGGFLIVSKKVSVKYFFKDHILLLVIVAAFLFAVSFIIMKSVFIRENFVSGFIWMRFGGLIAAAILFFSREVRNSILTQKTGLQKRVLVPLLFFQTAGGAGFVLQNLAVSLAAVSQVPLVNALEGTRYLFLFIFVGLLAKWRPALLKEEMQGAVLWQKIIAGAIIIFGIILLTIFK